MRKRAGALYIRDKKLFLICEGQQGFYWTPGGGLEEGESFDEALEREILEELNAQLLSAKLYVSIEDTKADEEVHYYLVDIALPDNLPGDTTNYWYSKEDFEAKAVKISQRILEKVYPMLIADNLV